MSSQEPLFIRVSRSRDLIGVSRSTIYRWAERGLIRIYRIGGVSLLRAPDVIALVQGGEDGSEEMKK